MKKQKTITWDEWMELKARTAKWLAEYASRGVDAGKVAVSAAYDFATEYHPVMSTFYFFRHFPKILLLELEGKSDEDLLDCGCSLPPMPKKYSVLLQKIYKREITVEEEE